MSLHLPAYTIGAQFELAPPPERSGRAQARRLVSASLSEMGRSSPAKAPSLWKRLPKKQPSVTGKLASSPASMGRGVPSARRPNTEMSTCAPYLFACAATQAETSCCSSSGTDSPEAQRGARPKTPGQEYEAPLSEA